jgi:hypothetical protein
LEKKEQRKSLMMQHINSFSYLGQTSYDTKKKANLFKDKDKDIEEKTFKFFWKEGEQT